MKLRTSILTVISGFVCIYVLAGCSQPRDSAVHHGSQGAGGHDNDNAMASMENGLSQLSQADRTSALEQHICPVSGEMLGAMGKPVRVTVDGYSVWLCCSSCADTFRRDPEKYSGTIANHANHQHDDGAAADDHHHPAR